MKVLSFRIADEICAIPMESVDEVLPYLPIEPIPDAPSYLVGLVHVRGNLVPVIDGAERMGIRRQAPAPEDPHIIAIILPEGELLGLVVDEVLELVEIPENAASWSPERFESAGPFGGVVETGGVIYRIIRPEHLLVRSVAQAGDACGGAA